MKSVFAAVATAAFAVQLAFGGATAGEALWSRELPGALKWDRISEFGPVIIATSGALLAVHPDTGEITWKRDDIKDTAPFNVKDIPGQPILLYNDHSGFANTKTTVQAINLSTGATIWQSKEIQGYNLGTYTVPGSATVLLFMNMWTQEEGSGTYIRAYDVTNGTQLWQTKYAKDGKVQTHIADNSGSFIVTQDLSGNQPPLIDGDTAYIPFMGLHAVDLKTGAIKWGVEFKTADKSLKRTYAQPVISGDVVYASGKETVYAINKNTGAIIWQSPKIKSALIAELVVTDGLVLGRMGGNFSNGKEIKADKPFGVVALDKATGAQKWIFDKARDSITNLAVQASTGDVLLADAKTLVGVNMASGQPSFSIPIEFKRSMGTAEMAATGMRAASGLLSGGLTGMAQGMLSSGKNSNRNDNPIDVTMLSGTQAIVRGQQHILSFDPTAKKINWSIHYEAPGVSDLSLLANGALTMLASSTQYGLHDSYSSRNTAVGNVMNMTGSFQDMAAKRYAAAAKSGQRAYFLTSLKEGEVKGPGIIGINMLTGEQVFQMILGEKEPKYIIDSVVNRLYYFKDQKVMHAYQM